MDRIDQVMAQLVGMTEESAEDLLAAENIVFEVASRDGSVGMLTDDDLYDRLRLTIRDKKVTKVTRG